MSLPDKFLFSDLLKSRVRCNKGLDHGIGIAPWMHPPVHRLLGWASRPSMFGLYRNVWRLNQIRAFSADEVLVMGTPYSSEQITLDRLPSLYEASLLNLNGLRLGSIVDFVFHPTDGKILYYLISRSDPRIPGTSRWSLTIDKILDQQPAIVSSNIISLDDLPLVRSSVRQDILRRSRNFREQIQDISDKASNRLEGWLEDPPWDDEDLYARNTKEPYPDDLDNWVDDSVSSQNESIESSLPSSQPSSSPFTQEKKDDPWI